MNQSETKDVMMNIATFGLGRRCFQIAHLWFCLFLIEGQCVANANELTLGIWQCRIGGTNRTFALVRSMLPKYILYKGKVNDTTIVNDFVLKCLEPEKGASSRSTSTVVWRHYVQTSITYPAGERWLFDLACDDAQGLMYLVAVSWAAAVMDVYEIKVYKLDPANVKPAPDPKFDNNGRMVTSTPSVTQVIAVLTEKFAANIREVKEVRTTMGERKLGVVVGFARNGSPLHWPPDSTSGFQFNLDK